MTAYREEQTQIISGLKQELVDAKEEIKLLKHRCLMLESTNPSRTHDSENVVKSDHIVNDESIILAGGYDGDSWLSVLDSSESLWCNTVESYNPADNTWTVHSCLNGKKGSLSGATLQDKIFAIGGRTDFESFSEVEMYDPQVAAELDGALYVVGGFDGSNWATAERFDPREHSWTKIESMSTKRGSYALVPLRGKLYALGGHDGSQNVSSIEIYDPRRGTWMIGEPMNYPMGYSTTAVLKESIYVIGGVQSDNELIDMIERYKEGEGWQTTDLRAVEEGFLLCYSFGGRFNA
ncbi:hypothetical protein RND71_003757 [Anisodus tanguticus]|uniref:Uncharacterized protein n=1 Tax=Anisodus tanguticus TaxID=243964 RepID=A0AAE1SX98_9SOLA|nr:hypothetical protein RND71_003757 [Anisodus tanguticus]